MASCEGDIGADLCAIMKTHLAREMKSNQIGRQLSLFSFTQHPGNRFIQCHSLSGIKSELKGRGTNLRLD
jgi:hypothetical protein